MNKYDLIKHLSLVEHIEGGYFSETYRSDCIISTEREGETATFLKRRSSNPKLRVFDFAPRQLRR
jgi:predicted cupin superfamily sugar epimerase